MDDCWLAEPDEDTDAAALGWLAADDVDGEEDEDEDDAGNGPDWPDTGPFGRIIMVAFFNV